MIWCTMHRVKVFQRTQEDCRRHYRDPIRLSIGHQVFYPDASQLKMPPCPRLSTDIQVVKGDSFEIAERMKTTLGVTPCVLNMASDRHPGGGVRKGASAQEEELCRRSTLYPVLEALKRHYSWPTHFTCVYTPGVVVFSDTAYAYLKTPFLTNVISAAALRRPAWTKDEAFKDADERLTLAKVSSFLQACVKHGQRHLVLGAWGCGAFGNPPKGMARVFKSLLTGAFAGYFETVWFAIKDNRASNNFAVFSSVFA